MQQQFFLTLSPKVWPFFPRWSAGAGNMHANVHAHVVLVFVMQRNQTGEDKCKQNYCLKSLEGTVSRGDLQVLHLSCLCFLERKKMCLLDWIRIRPLCIGGLFVSSFKEGSVCWNLTLTLLLCHSPVDLTAASFLSLLISNFCWFPFVNTKAEKLQI